MDTAIVDWLLTQPQWVALVLFPAFWFGLGAATAIAFKNFWK